MTSGGSISELLQISADRWVSAPAGQKQQRLLPERARSDHQRRVFEIGHEAAQLLAEIEQALVQAHGDVPAVPASRQLAKSDSLQPERYVFQWQRAMLNPQDTEILVRFVLYGVQVSTSEGKPISFTMGRLRFKETARPP
jgi:hypothetical protein